MNSYAAAIGNLQVVTQDYERRCQEFERMAMNARIQAERDAESAPAGTPGSTRASSRRTSGPVAAFRRVVGRRAIAH